MGNTCNLSRVNTGKVNKVSVQFQLKNVMLSITLWMRYLRSEKNEINE